MNRLCRCPQGTLTITDRYSDGGPPSAYTLDSAPFVPLTYNGRPLLCNKIQHERDEID
jgi:hypothetical protein